MSFRIKREKDKFVSYLKKMSCYDLKYDSDLNSWLKKKVRKKFSTIVFVKYFCYFLSDFQPVVFTFKSRKHSERQ